MTATTRLIFSVLCLALSYTASAQDSAKETPIVTVPYMERAGLHREYTNAILQLALETSAEKFGPYEIVKQTRQTVIRRQLLELEKGQTLSVAVSMPMAEWLEKARVVQFPLMKGLASYRLFFAHEKNLQRFNNIQTLEALKELKVGQGPGWSTAQILEDNGFQVEYGGPYKTLFPMLGLDRFQLLMRGVYEIAPEYKVYKEEMPELAIVDGIAIYTYLPMYFFVSKKQIVLADRLEYGLKQAHKSGQIDKLFDEYFGETLKLLNIEQRKIFYLKNTNIDASFYQHDKPYLLESVNKLELTHNTGKPGNK